MANRFSKPVNPLVVNPISIDTFSKIPLAKAAANAAGVVTANSLDLKYNVDVKDEAAVKGMVEPIAAAKDATVNRIIDEGVSDDLIDDFLKLRTDYNAVRKNVDKAQENNMRIEKWKSDVLQVHANDPMYVEFIKQKEYKDDWQGTFIKGENGNMVTQTFDKGLGPKSFSIASDFANELKGLPSSYTEAIKNGTGSFKLYNTPDGQKQLVFVDTNKEVQHDNIDNVNAMMSALMREYRDPSTERGAYVTYRKIGDEQIDNIANDVAMAMYKVDRTGGETKRSVVSGGAGKEKEVEIPMSNEELLPRIETYSNTGLLVNTLDAGLQINKNLNRKQRANKVGTWLSSVAGYSNITNADWSTEEALENIAKTKADVEAEGITDEYIEEVARESVELIHGYSYDLNRNLALAPILGMSESSLTKANALNEALAYNKGEFYATPTKEMRASSKVIGTYMKGSSTRTKDSSIVLDRADPLVATGTKDADASRSVAMSLDPNNLSVDVLSLDEKRMITSEDAEFITMAGAAMANPGQKPPIGVEGYVSTFMGQATGDPAIYTVKDDDGNVTIPDGVAFGNVFRLQAVDKKGNIEVASTRIVVGPKLGKKDTPKYQALQANLQTLGELQPGDVRNATYMSKNKEGEVEYISVDVESVDMVTPAIDHNGRVITAQPGQTVIHKGGQTYPEIYNPDYLDRLDFSKVPSTNTPQRDEFQTYLDVLYETELNK